MTVDLALNKRSMDRTAIVVCIVVVSSVWYDACYGRHWGRVGYNGDACKELRP